MRVKVCWKNEAIIGGNNVVRRLPWRKGENIARFLRNDNYPVSSDIRLDNSFEARERARRIT